MKNIKEYWVYIVSVVAIVVLLGHRPILSYATKDYVEFTVIDKERVVKDEESYYLIFTDKGVFKNTDDFWQLKFNSSDLQGKLQNGKLYKCSKNFWRIQFLSVYENLIDCKEVD